MANRLELDFHFIHRYLARQAPEPRTTELPLPLGLKLRVTADARRIRFSPGALEVPLALSGLPDLRLRLHRFVWQDETLWFEVEQSRLGRLPLPLARLLRWLLKLVDVGDSDFRHEGRRFGVALNRVVRLESGLEIVDVRFAESLSVEFDVATRPVLPPVVDL